MKKLSKRDYHELNCGQGSYPEEPVFNAENHVTKLKGYLSDELPDDIRETLVNEIKFWEEKLNGT